VYAIICMGVFYSDEYRIGDFTRVDGVIDRADVSYVVLAAEFGALILMPWLTGLTW
jgi:hypothetical protein